MLKVNIKSFFRYILAAHLIFTASLQGMTRLHIAARRDDADLARQLIAEGADVNSKQDNSIGATPLHGAARLGNVEVMRLLIKHGADVNSKIQGPVTLHGATPLHWAASNNRLKAAQLLIEHGADANNKDGCITPLYMAAFRNHEIDDSTVELIKLLLEHGADPSTIHYFDKERDWDPEDSTVRGMVLRNLKTHGSQRKYYLEILKMLDNALKKQYRTVMLLQKEKNKNFPVAPQLIPIIMQYVEPSLSKFPLPTIPPRPPETRSSAGKIGRATAAGPAPIIPPAVPPTLFNRRNLIIAVLSALPIAGYGLYEYVKPQEIPTNLDKDALYIQIVTALTNKNFEYAYKLAKNNPQTLRKISADKLAKHDLAQLIYQTQANLFHETAENAESWNPLNHCWRPSLTIQLKYLDDLLHRLEKSKKNGSGKS